LGQTVLIENRTGGNGNVAARASLQEPVDGNTLWVALQSTVEINPSAFDTMPWQPEDFTPIIRGVEAPLVLVVHKSVPANNFKELVAWLKENRGNVEYASFSPGTPSHFLGYQLSEHFDLDMVHVPYRGSAPQITDLMGGHAKVGFAQMLNSLPALESNNLKAIATTGSKRSRHLPDVPTLNELGLPEMDTSIWFGLFAPSAAP